MKQEILKKLLILLPTILIFSLFSCSKDDKEGTDKNQEEGLPPGIEFSMMVDGKTWVPKSIVYTAFQTGSEPGADYENDIIPHTIVVRNISHKEFQELSKSDKIPEHYEAFTIMLSIPLSRVTSVEGKHEFSEASDLKIPHPKNQVSFINKGDKLYSNNYDINTYTGHVNITKGEYGNRGSIGGMELGNGFKKLEGTFEFELHPINIEGKPVKITEGKFKLSPIPLPNSI